MPYPCTWQKKKEGRWEDKGYAFQLIPSSSFISEAVDVASVHHLKLSLVPREVHVTHLGRKYMGAQLSLLNLSSLKDFSSPQFTVLHSPKVTPTVCSYCPVTFLIEDPGQLQKETLTQEGKVSSPRFWGFSFLFNLSCQRKTTYKHGPFTRLNPSGAIFSAPDLAYPNSDLQLSPRTFIQISPFKSLSNLPGKVGRRATIFLKRKEYQPWPVDWNTSLH